MKRSVLMNAVFAATLFWGMGCGSSTGSSDDTSSDGGKSSSSKGSSSSYDGPPPALEIRCINPINEAYNGSAAVPLASVPGLGRQTAPPPLFENPDLTGKETRTITTSLMFGIGDVWVSQSEVKAGEPDTLTWIKLTETTNTELKLFEEYTFRAMEIPPGEYKSIRISFRNIAYRYARLESDPTVIYRLLETMGSSEDPCNPDDTTWTNENYFSTDGNHVLGKDSLFRIVAEGEKVGGFTIEEGKTTLVQWRFGAGYEGEPCINRIIDNNNNRKWDCGIDEIQIDCPDPGPELMWDFVVEYIDQ